MSLRSGKAYFGIGILTLGIGAGVWGLTMSSAGGEPSLLPEELSVASLKTQIAEDPSQFRRTMREQSDLTDEQRQELRRNMRTVFTSMMTGRLDEYFAAAPDEQDEVLDRHIDEMQERMKKWREQRESAEADRQKEGDGDRENWRERMRERRANETSEQRKTRSESRDPDQMARRMAYFQAVRSRMSERGIESSWGRGGRGRGGGGRFHGGG